MSKGYLYDNGEELITRDGRDMIITSTAPDGTVVVFEEGTIAAPLITGISFTSSDKKVHFTVTRDEIRKAMDDGVPVFGYINCVPDHNGLSEPKMQGVFARIDSVPAEYKISVPMVPVIIDQSIITYISSSPITIGSGTVKEVAVNDSFIKQIVGVTV